MIERIKPVISKLITVKSTILTLAVATLMGVSISQAADDAVVDGIKERIAPVGELCMAGNPCAAAPAAPVAAGPRGGQEIYDTKCTTCHTAGISGAPRLGQPSDWAPRIDQGMSGLFDHAWNGFNAMPAKGLCLDCSEDEIRAAIQYMVDNSK